jgi:hypothetical protein
MEQNSGQDMPQITKSPLSGFFEGVCESRPALPEILAQIPQEKTIVAFKAGKKRSEVNTGFSQPEVMQK